MASPINASLFEEFDITSSDGQRTVSLIGGILSFQYFENLLSPNVTAVLSIFNTGNTTNGQGLYNGLPVRGGDSGTQIDSMPGMTYDSTEDLEYLKLTICQKLKKIDKFLHYIIK